MITVNGVPLPIPSSVGVDILDVSKAERNAAGTMLIDLIAIKRKLILAWDSLSAEQLSLMLKSIPHADFTVVYPDPEDGAVRSGIFYRGDRHIEALSYWNGVIRWKNITLNLIEQ